MDPIKDQKIRLTTIRLYRILQRLCRDFRNERSDTTTRISTSTDLEQQQQQQQSDEQRMILLQPNLVATDWGRHSIYMSPTTTHVDELFRLFYVWNDNPDDVDDEEDDNDDTKKNERSGIVSSSSSSWSSSSSSSTIDDWYYELTQKRKRRRGNNNNNNSSTSASSMAEKEEEDNENDDDDDDEHPMLSTSIPPMTSMACWTSSTQLREAVRIAFKTLGGGGEGKDLASSSSSSSIPPSVLHKWAIRAVQNLQEQKELWAHSSTVVTDGIVRITATSRCIGTTTPVQSSIPPPITTAQTMAESTPKYRFAYRIRVENICTPIPVDTDDDENIDGKNKNNNSDYGTTAVQLMGRYWHISEHSLGGEDLPTALSQPIIVNAPVTGAVGQLPVLLPGQAFEYMSGTDLVTPRGTMKGHLYMAIVPTNTRSGKSGDDIDALKKKQQQQSPSSNSVESNNNNNNTSRSGKEEKDQDRSVEGTTKTTTTHFFEAKVAPFPLDASGLL
jgi:uncharacterized protein affecting Mg2+/Co2+ transport